MKFGRDRKRAAQANKSPPRSSASKEMHAEGPLDDCKKKPPIDEIAQYVRGRYLESSEAAWHLLNFKMQSQFPNVVRLGVHLDGDQLVTFGESATAEQMGYIPKPTSTLEAFFHLNHVDPFARTLLYREIPAYYT